MHDHEAVVKEAEMLLELRIIDHQIINTCESSTNVLSV
jgi:hypothetical protein